MPLYGNQLAVTLILPDPGRYDEIESSLGPGLLTDARTIDPGAPAVRLALPKFKLETSLELSAALERMGITNAFRPAQFDAISKGAGLHISTVVHKTFVAVDERGIEEAAATGVAVATSARSKAVDMRFNRPFLIALTDEPTGAPLFLGRVTEPSA